MLGLAGPQDCLVRYILNKDCQTLFLVVFFGFVACHCPSLTFQSLELRGPVFGDVAHCLV